MLHIVNWDELSMDMTLISKASQPVTRCNAVRVTGDLLEKNLDLLLHKSFAERPHDFNQALSVEDRVTKI